MLKDRDGSRQTARTAAQAMSSERTRRSVLAQFLQQARLDCLPLLFLRLLWAEVRLFP